MRMIEEHVFYLKECPWRGCKLDWTKCIFCRFFDRDWESVGDKPLVCPDNEKYWCLYETTNPIDDIDTEKDKKGLLSGN